MSTIRRIALVLVTLALIADAGALVVIKMGSGPKPSDEKSKVVVWVDKQEEAQGIAAVFKTAGYEPIVKAATREEKVEADFRLAMHASKKSLLDPVAQVLKQNGHKNISFSADGTTLYFGGVYKQKAQALKQAERLKTKDRFIFEVVRGQKVQKFESFRVILLEVPDNMISGLTEPLYEDYEVKEIEEIALDRDEEEAEPEAADEPAADEDEEEDEEE